MAGRQNKVGLDYFELDCHMDDKFGLIEAEYGLKGFAIVVKLYQSIYSGFGYYCEWTPDISVLWASRLGLSHGGDFGKVDNTSYEGLLSGFPKNLINDVVAASIRRDIFSKDLFIRYGILTSKGIQTRYLNATSKRKKVVFEKEYLLINVPQNSIYVVINSISYGINSISGGRNTQSRVEKSREENISDDGDARARELAYKLLLVYWGRNPVDHDINRISDLISVRGPCGLVVNDNAVDLLEYAFKSSSDAGVYNWNYITGIMDNLRARNITTLDEAYEYEIQNGK